MKRVTKRQAEAATKAIAKAFGAEEGYGPKLVQDYEGLYSTYRFAVLWEGGPYEWPFLLQGGFNDEMFSLLHPEFEPDAAKARERCTLKPVPLPKDVVAEAINHYSVALYSKEEY